jgi:hypothetical protein
VVILSFRLKDKKERRKGRRETEEAGAMRERRSSRNKGGLHFCVAHEKNQNELSKEEDDEEEGRQPVEVEKKRMKTKKQTRTKKKKMNQILLTNQIQVVRANQNEFRQKEEKHWLGVELPFL